MVNQKTYQEPKPTFAIILGLIAASIIIGACILFAVSGNKTNNDQTGNNQAIIAETQLPAPELSEGIRGSEFGIDKNINETTLDDYLGRSDTVYRDMRMLKDPGNYEAIGGDSYLSGFVEGFEIVPLPYLVNVSGLPSEVGDTYTGKTLFTKTSDGDYKANYAESMAILEYLFPKDKNIFLMCGGGGYAGMTKSMLAELGWDAGKIYNVGAYWSYDGDHNIIVKNTEHGDTTYDFWKVPYHDIDFKTLHELESEK